MKALLKMAQAQFKSDKTKREALEASGDIILKNPYKRVPAPSPPTPLPRELGTENLTLDDVCKENPEEVIENIKHIGGGGCSQVYSGYLKETKQKVAIKKMSIDEWYEADLLMEIAMMKTSKHENIVNYIDSYKDDTGDIWACYHRFVNDLKSITI